MFTENVPQRNIRPNTFGIRADRKKRRLLPIAPPSATNNNLFIINNLENKLLFDQAQ